MGADIQVLNERVQGGEPVADLHVQYAGLKGIHVPEALVPLAIDEFPAIFAAAALAKGTTRVTGAHELRVKESDRLAAMADGLRAVGVAVEEFDDGYWGPLREHDRAVRDELMDGRRHVFEAEMKERRRTHGRSGHEARPAD